MVPRADCSVEQTRICNTKYLPKDHHEWAGCWIQSPPKASRGKYLGRDLKCPTYKLLGVMNKWNYGGTVVLH